eukprot:SAG31_NODE_37685_length_302_cov_0.763547_1_plen_40_part_10
MSESVAREPGIKCSVLAVRSGLSKVLVYVCVCVQEGGACA